MSFGDKISGFVLTPVLMDLFNKLHLGKAGKETAERFKQLAMHEYVRDVRQLKLWLIKPLRFFHALATLVLTIVLILSAVMISNSSGEAGKYFWISVQLIAIAVNLYFVFRIPSNPIYEVDAAGKPVRFPRTRMVDGQEVEHIFAGQRKLAPGHKIDYNKINPILSMNATALVGLISSLALGMLCRDTGDRRFLALSLAVGLPSLFCFDIFIRLADWIGGKIIRLAEKTAGYVGMQLAIMLPYIEEGDVSADMADKLIPEQEFLPAWIRIRDMYLEIYLLFIGALLAFPTPNTFNWVASSLTFVAITSFLMTKVGLGESVLARKRKFYLFLFSIVAPFAIGQMFFKTFFPEQAEQVRVHLNAMFVGAINLFGFAAHPCDHIVTGRPWMALGIAAACVWCITKLYPVWDKATKKSVAIVTGAGLALLIIVGFGGLAGFYIGKTDSKLCIDSEVPPALVASASAAIEAPPVPEEKKAETVSEAQVLLVKQMGDQSEIGIEYLKQIAVKILANNKEMDDADNLTHDQRMKRLDALTKLRESILAFEAELKATVRPLSPDGIASLTDIQKQLMVDTDALAKIKVAIVDGTSTFTGLPDKSQRTVAAIKRHMDDAIAQVRTAPTTTPVSDEEKALAEQKRLAEISAIKLAAMKAPATVPQAEETETRPSKPTTMSTAKQSVSCEGCTDKFAKLAARLRENKQQ